MFFWHGKKHNRTYAGWFGIHMVPRPKPKNDWLILPNLDRWRQHPRHDRHHRR